MVGIDRQADISLTWAYQQSLGIRLLKTPSAATDQSHRTSAIPIFRVARNRQDLILALIFTRTREIFASVPCASLRLHILH